MLNEGYLFSQLHTNSSVHPFKMQIGHTFRASIQTPMRSHTLSKWMSCNTHLRHPKWVPLSETSTRFSHHQSGISAGKVLCQTNLMTWSFWSSSKCIFNYLVGSQRPKACSNSPLKDNHSLTRWSLNCAALVCLLVCCTFYWLWH